MVYSIPLDLSEFFCIVLELWKQQTYSLIFTNLGKQFC
jgi:hypothetical protein